jgi:hypothetical protein
MSPSSSPLPPSLPSSPVPSSLVEPSAPSSESRRHLRRRLRQTTWHARNSLSSGPPRSSHRHPPVLRRSHALPRTHRRRHLHLPVPRQGATGGPHHWSGTRRPLTRPRSPTPLRPSVEERRPHRRPWSLNSKVISRLVSDSVEGLEESEDDEAMAREWVSRMVQLLSA